MEIGSYAGTILRVDLTSKKTKKEKLNPDVARKFLGAHGLAAYYLFNEIPPRVPAFSEENKFAIFNGPLIGTPAPNSVKTNVATKSPLTGGWTDGNFSGTWGIELRKAGYDGIIIEGKAEKPVYLFIEDQEVKLLDASKVWGANTFETMRLLKETHMTDREPKVLCIGPAAEKLVLTTTTMAEVRAGGRGGTGAVLGFKKLKAITVVGHGEVSLADPDKFEEARKNAVDKMLKSPITGTGGSHQMMGTSSIVSGVNAAGALPTRNFQTGVFEAADEICGEAYKTNLWQGGTRRRPCPRCINMCTHVAVIEKGKWAGVVDEGPDYENIVLLGSDCGIGDREAIATAEYLCDYYGIDGISVGNTIGFLMECYEKGLISKDDTDGINLRFGDSEAMLEALVRISTRTGKLGELGALGVRRASEKIGKGSEKFAMHVKGLEMPAYDPRAAFGMGLCYARSDRGACHLRPWTFGAECLGLAPAQEPFLPYSIKGKGRWVKEQNDIIAAYNCSGLCQFAAFGLDAVSDVVAMVNAATGFNLTPEEYMKVGERVHNLTRAFWFREVPDFGTKYDMLPWRCLHEPLPEGPAKGKTVPLEPMLQEYYEVSGWDKNGKPTKAKLLELGLDFAVKQIY
jgi:aldehyde:ferredoxin oxidoreductase